MNPIRQLLAIGLCCVVFLAGCWLVRPMRYSAFYDTQNARVGVIDGRTGQVTIYFHNPADRQNHSFSITKDAEGLSE